MNVKNTIIEENYKSYVGPEDLYDVIGALQFRLLTTLGLRSSHKILDFGCGSLRAGKLLIPYLDPGCYFGIEPNYWLVNEAILHEIGQDLINIKKPTFDSNDEFSTSVFNVEFDFILAQSIFSHAGISATTKCMSNFADRLSPDGLILATFFLGYKDPDIDWWTYPGIVTYRFSTIQKLAADNNLKVLCIPWFHPKNQVWFMFGHTSKSLPEKRTLKYLNRVILRGDDFRKSWQQKKPLYLTIYKILDRLKSYISILLKHK
jgi:SAM-dependent methyltransferase